MKKGVYHLNLAPTIYCGLKRLAFKARFRREVGHLLKTKKLDME
jgi:hypothetical protein